MNKYIIRLTQLFLISTGSNIFCNSNTGLPMKKTAGELYCQYANEIQESTIRQIEKEYKATCYGSGGGMPYFIRELHLSFSVKEMGSIERARYLIVNMTEILIEQIHKHKKARPYLVSYPFPVENAQISLDFVLPNGKDNEEGIVNIISSGGGKISYKSSKNGVYPYTKILIEPYEDAYKIVKGHPRPENLKPGPMKQAPILNRDGSIKVPALLDNDPKNHWPK